MYYYNQDDFDQEDMSPGLITFIFALMGGGLLVGGVITTIIFVPAGLLMMGLGGLCIIGSPIIGLAVWWDERQDSS